MEKEIRYFESELRADSESRMIEGYAIVFNKDSQDLGGFVERVLPESVDGRLQDDIVALFNHDQNMILARNGVTLELSKDDKGVKYRFEAPNTQVGNDLLENVRLGNISKSSFAFRVDQDGQKWETRKDGPDVRTITKFTRLYDVSPVVTPAYLDTTVAQRSRPKEEETSFNKWKINLKRKRLKLT